MSANAPETVPPPRPEGNRSEAWSQRFGVMVVVGVLLLPGIFGFMEWRKQDQTKACRANLHRIGLALQAYHEKYDCLPPAYVLGADERRWHSWRVLLLPFLGEEQLYKEYRFDEPWDGPHNRMLRDRIPKVYACPVRGATGVTTYLAVVGRATVWPEQYTARCKDVLDGTSSTISIIESTESDIDWLEPRDLTYAEAANLDRPAGVIGPRSAGHYPDEFQTLFVDGAVRRIRSTITRGVYRSLLSIRSGWPLPGIDWPLEGSSSEAPIPPPRPAENYTETEITPFPESPIVRGRNSVYCATFEIAWDAACQKFGRPLDIAGDPELARELNAHQFKLSNLSPDSYTAMGGPGNAEFRQQIEQQLQSKFQDSNPLLIDPDGNDHVLQLYAYLLKILPFQVSFDNLPTPLEFHAGDKTIPVASFGIEGLTDDTRSEQMQSQIEVLDYVNDDDFAVKLISHKHGDQIVLA